MDKKKNTVIRIGKFSVLTIGIIIISVIALLLLGVWFVNKNTQEDIDNTIIEQYETLQLNVAKGTASHLAEKIHDLQIHLKTIALLPEVRNGNTEDCSAKLREVISEIEGVDVGNLGRVNKDGTFYCGVSEGMIGLDGMQYPFIKEIIEDPDHTPVLGDALWFTYPEVGEKYITALHIPIFDENGNFSGTLGGAIFFEDLQELYLKAEPVTEGSYITLLDDNGDSLYHPNHELIGVNIYGEQIKNLLNISPGLGEILYKAVDGENGVGRYEFEGEYKLAAYNSVEILPNRYWSVIVTAPVEEIRGQIDPLVETLSFQVYSVIVIIAVLSFTVIVILYRWNVVLKSEVDERTSELKKFQLAVENAAEHIVITDPDGIIIYANNGVKRITGYEPKEIIGKKAGTKDLWGGLMDGDFYKLLWTTVKKEKTVFRGEIINKRKNGEQYEAEASISPVLGTDGELQYFVAIERDISKFKELERARTALISLVSHQLRTPLTGIAWALDILKDDERLSDAQKDLIQDAIDSEKRMGILINDMLESSRLDLDNMSINPRSVNFIKLVEEVIAELNAVIKSRGQRIDFAYDKEFPLVTIDKGLIREAVINLISNASKYSHEGDSIQLNLDITDGDLLLKIKDHGIGIKKEDQDKIFTKFFRTAEAKQQTAHGTGLGLNIAKSIVEASKGKIWFESQEGKGTTFFISLPIK